MITKAFIASCNCSYDKPRERECDLLDLHLRFLFVVMVEHIGRHDCPNTTTQNLRNNAANVIPLIGFFGKLHILAIVSCVLYPPSPTASAPSLTTAILMELPSNYQWTKSFSINRKRKKKKIHLPRLEAPLMMRSVPSSRLLLASDVLG